MAKPKKTPSTAKSPLTKAELASIDLWWSACNYLSVGMIYLQDNPLLRAPLKPEHVKQRLLGHWGASPALSFVWAHLNRVIKRDDLDVIFIAGPGHGAPGVIGPDVSRRHVHGDLSGQERRRRGHAEALQAVLLPRSHRLARDARDAGLDPRRRRARLQPFARLRSRARQPRAHRRVRRRRRRGRDRAARDGLALEQIPQPRPRRRGPPDPATSTATRSPIPRFSRGSITTSSRRCSSATATSRTSSRAPTRAVMHQAMAATLDAAVAEIRGFWKDARRRSSSKADPPALADDRAALAEGLDGTEGDSRQESGRLLAFSPGAVLRRARQSAQPQAARELATQLRAREAVRCGRKAAPELKALAPVGGRRMSVESATRTAACCAKIFGCPTFATTPSQCARRARCCTRTRSRSASSCAT